MFLSRNLNDVYLRLSKFRFPLKTCGNDLGVLKWQLLVKNYEPMLVASLSIPENEIECFGLPHRKLLVMTDVLA